MMTQTKEVRRLPDLKERHLPEDCRQGVTELLRDTYGYDCFRNLEIYDDLFKSRETLCISQGQLIENVIREAEKAQKEETQPDNILLTALPVQESRCCFNFRPSIWAKNIIC